MALSIKEIKAIRTERLKRVVDIVDNELLQNANLEGEEENIVVCENLGEWAKEELAKLYLEKGWASVRWEQVKYSRTDLCPNGYSHDIVLKYKRG